MAKKKVTLIPKVRSLMELRRLASTDPRYLQLLMAASRNLGYHGPTPGTLDQHYRWLELNAMETDEDGVVNEVNFVRDCI